MIEKHLSPGEAAERLGVSRDTVERWLRLGAETKGVDGIYPAFKLGRRCIRIPASAIERCLARRMVRA